MSQISEYFRSIFFPNLGITLRNIGDHINIGSFEVRFYGIIIMIGFLLAYVLVTNEAKRTKQNPEMYLISYLYLSFRPYLEQDSTISCSDLTSI